MNFIKAKRALSSAADHALVCAYLQVVSQPAFEKEKQDCLDRLREAAEALGFELTEIKDITMREAS